MSSGAAGVSTAAALFAAGLFACASPTPRAADAGLRAPSKAAAPVAAVPEAVAPEAAAPEPAAPEPAAPEAAALDAASPRVAALRVVASEGSVTGVDSEAGLAGARPQLVRLARGARLQLALADHTRLTVEGPATLRVAPDDQPALLLREGVVSVDAAAPVRADLSSTLWIATPSARFETGQRARFVLRAGPRASMLALVSGGVRVRQRDRVQDLAAGGDVTHCLGARARWSHASLTGKLEQRAQRITKLPPCAGGVSEPTDALLAAELEALLTRQQQSEARVRATLADHARRADSAPRAAAAQQRALAQQAAAAMQLGDELRARRSVLSARRLGSTPKALADLLARAREAAP